MSNDGDIYLEIIELKEELADYKKRVNLGLSYTFDLLMTSVNLTKQQKLIIRQIREALGEKTEEV